MSYLVRIYKIIVLTDDDYEPYIGATKQTLHERMINHKNLYKRWKNDKTNHCASFHLFEKYGFENCKITLLNTYTVSSKKEQLIIEQEWIDKIPNCNQRKSYITEEQERQRDKEYHKQYRNENANKITERNKEKFTCECGGKYTKSNKTIHERTKKHINYSSAFTSTSTGSSVCSND